MSNSGHAKASSFTSCGARRLTALLRSWVPLPSCPFFTTRELRHYFELFVGQLSDRMSRNANMRIIDLLILANQQDSIEDSYQSFLYVMPLSSVTPLPPFCPGSSLLFRLSITTITIPAMIVKKPIVVNTPPTMTTDKLLRSTPGSG